MEYTIKFRFSSAKVSRGGGVRGSGGEAECDITTDHTKDELEAYPEQLREIAAHSIKANPKLKGHSILSVDIIAVEQKIR